VVVMAVAGVEMEAAEAVIELLRLTHLTQDMCAARFCSLVFEVNGCWLILRHGVVRSH
jgi:hypothetical protein